MTIKTFVVSPTGVDKPIVLKFQAQHQDPEFSILASLSNLVRFVDIGSPDSYMVVETAHISNIIELSGQEPNPERVAVTIGSLITIEMTKNGWVVFNETVVEQSDPRTVSGDFGGFILTTSRNGEDFTYDVSSGGQSSFTGIIGTAEQARQVATQIDNYMSALEAIRSTLLQCNSLWSDHAAGDVVEPGEGGELAWEDAHGSDPVDSNLGGMERGLNSCLTEPTDVPDGQLDALLANMNKKAPAPVKQVVDHENNGSAVDVNRAVLLMARKGESTQMELVFTGPDVQSLADMDIVGYVKAKAPKLVEVIYVNSDDRNLMILESQLAAQYIHVFAAAIGDLKLNVKVDRQSVQVGPRRQDTLYL